MRRRAEAAPAASGNHSAETERSRSFHGIVPHLGSECAGTALASENSDTRAIFATAPFHSLRKRGMTLARKGAHMAEKATPRLPSLPSSNASESSSWTAFQKASLSGMEE